MGKSFSRQRELEGKLLAERDNLFKEFSCAKREIQTNFNHQRIKLEEAFHQEIEKLYKIHDTQIKTIKLQMRDSQLGDLQEKLKGKLSRHLSWPIAQSTPKHSQEYEIYFSKSKADDGRSSELGKSSDEWQILVKHLKFALNNQKSVFENTLIDEKLKMQGQLEKEREVMEEKIFIRLNKTLENALKERDLLLKGNQQGSRNILKDVMLNNRVGKNKGRKKFVVDSDSDDDECSGDSGVEEKRKKSDHSGNYWRIKYMESQRKHLRKVKEDEERYKFKENLMRNKFEKEIEELEQKRIDELNEMEIRSTKELQKLLMEERLMHKDAIKDLNGRLIEMSSENEDLKERLEEMNHLLGTDVSQLHQDLMERLHVLQDVLAQE